MTVYAGLARACTVMTLANAPHEGWRGAGVPPILNVGALGKAHCADSAVLISFTFVTFDGDVRCNDAKHEKCGLSGKESHRCY